MALHFELKPGSEDEVAAIFAESGRPEHTVLDDDGNEVGRLLRTLVFVQQGRAIRAIEVDGDMMAIARHMSQQQEVKDVEALLDPHLAEERDMTSEAGAIAYFMKAGMRCVLDRSADQ